MQLIPGTLREAANEKEGKRGGNEFIVILRSKGDFSLDVEYAVRRNNVDLSPGDATETRSLTSYPEGHTRCGRGNLTTNIDFLTFINATDR